MPALFIGLAAGLFCYFMCAVVKAKFGYDDSLDAFGVHGAGGTLGAILTGVCATNASRSQPVSARRSLRSVPFVPSESVSEALPLNRQHSS